MKTYLYTTSFYRRDIAEISLSIFFFVFFFCLKQFMLVYSTHWPFYSMKLLHCRLDKTSHITKSHYNIPIETLWCR